MRLATLNTFGMRADWDSRRAILRSGFAELDADVITLQETVVTDDVDQVSQILDPSYHVVHGMQRKTSSGCVPRQLALHSEVFALSVSHAVTNVRGQYT